MGYPTSKLERSPRFVALEEALKSISISTPNPSKVAIFASRPYSPKGSAQIHQDLVAALSIGLLG